MRTLINYFLSFPRNSIFVLIAFLAAGIAEGLSITALLPLLSIAVGDPVDSNIGRFIVDALNIVNITPAIGSMLLIIVGCMILKSLVLLIANRQVGFTVAYVASSLRVELIEALLASRWQYYLRRPAGSLANSIASEAFRAAIGFEHGAAVIATAVQVLIYIIIAMLISWQAALTSLAIGIILMSSVYRLILATRRAGNKQTRILSRLLTYLADVLGSVKSLKAMARDNIADAILRDQTKQLEKATRKEIMNREGLKAIQEPVLAALTASALYVALVIWELSLPAVTMMVFLLIRILTLMNKMQRRYQHLTIQESAYWALKESIEEARATPERNTGTVKPTLKQGINLRHVSFNYDKKSIFKDLNLEIPSKSFTTIMGSSGIGKSTLLDLLCGLAEPESGEILIDGVSLHEINLRDWRQMIGYVSQENVLLHDTILNNILVGASNLSQADAERALYQAGAWDFVNALPEGLNTIVGERGGLLSGGQRQRIAIARALAHQPQFLLLDEPTSALDPESERTICETLQNLKHNLTIIAVSHQPALVNAADHVYTLVQGKAKQILADQSTVTNS